MSNELDVLALRSHPRVILTSERLTQLMEDVKRDPFASKFFENLKRQADLYRQQPPAEHRLEGRRLLGVSRRVLSHVLCFALLGRITEEQHFVDAAREAMLTAATFPDWNPSHFLDVAEMAMALATGYDWLYDELSLQDRETIETALIEKALRPSLEQDWFWIKGHNNWNPVCHAGLTFAALALAEKEPQMARTVVDRARANVSKVADAYGPDGAYDEGPMYWDYGTSFLVLLSAAIESATGEAFNPNIPGLLPSADYMMHAVGPTGRFYNYSDCRINRSPTAALFWFARKLNRPSLAALDRAKLMDGIDPTGESNRLLPMALIWHQPQPAGSSEPLPRVWTGGGRTPVALMRTRWDDPGAAFLGIKGGSPSNSHGHMDVGSFVYEANGVRWAIDLPMQDYHSLESAGVNLWDGTQAGERWKVFRNGPESHGILRFNGSAQAVQGVATLRAMAGENAVGRADVDLSSMYPGSVTSATRRATLHNDDSVEIVDQWHAAGAELDVAWQWLTTAQVTVCEDGFDLNQDGKTLSVQIDADGEAFSVSVIDVQTLMRSSDAPNVGVSRITIQMQTKPISRGRLTVRLLPVSKADHPNCGGGSI